MKNLNKVFTLGMIALIIVSVVILIWGFAAGWNEGFEPKAATNVLLGWTYVMVVIAVAAVIIPGAIIAIKNDPKSLVRFGIGIAGCAVLCLIAYVFASGNPAIGLTGMDPSKTELKLTDTILNLTYIVGACAIIAIVAGEIRMAMKDKK